MNTEFKFTDDSWAIFSLITSVYYGKEFYFREEHGLVYSRKSNKHITEMGALIEFLDSIGWDS